jgi:hypothetical protein
MRARDIALIGFRLLALWFAVSAIQALVELLLSWKSFHAQMSSSMAGSSNPLTEGQLFLLTTSAMVGRTVVGIGLWWSAPHLARLSFPDSSAPRVSQSSRSDLFHAASFLVGVWLLGASVPGLVFFAVDVFRNGLARWQEGTGLADVGRFLATAALGFAFVRGGWLVRWALKTDRVGLGAGAEDGVEQGHEAVEAQGRKPGDPGDLH